MSPLPGAWPPLTRSRRCAARATRARSRSSTWNGGHRRAHLGAEAIGLGQHARRPGRAVAVLRPRSTPRTVWHTASDRLRSRSRGRCGCGTRLVPSVSWIRSASVAAVGGVAFATVAPVQRAPNPACARNKMCGLRSRRPASSACRFMSSARATSPSSSERPREPRVQRTDEAAHADLFGERRRLSSSSSTASCVSAVRVRRSRRGSPSVIESMTGRSAGGETRRPRVR